MKNNVIFLECTSSYPYRFSASNTKVEFLAKGLTESGDVCVIHNGVVGSTCVEKPTYSKINGISEVITYPKKSNQLISWIPNLHLLCRDLKALYKKDCKNFIVLSMPDYHIFMVYVHLARHYGYKIVTISHEWGPTVPTTHILRKPSVWLFSKTFGHFSDGILPISEYIIRKIQHWHKPFLKVPILADFSQDKQEKTERGHFFMYCGDAGYKRVIVSIIDAFSNFHKNHEDYKLKLVLSGEKNYMGEIRQYIATSHLDDVVLIKTAVPYKELWNMYRTANGLIILLDPNVEQDEARFSQKIAEYLSSNTPIITNNVGEIKYYFENKKNAVICDYCVKGVTDSMEWIATHKAEAETIGHNGYLLGQKEFNYKIMGAKLNEFLQSI